MNTKVKMISYKIVLIVLIVLDHCILCIHNPHSNKICYPIFMIAFLCQLWLQFLRTDHPNITSWSRANKKKVNRVIKQIHLHNVHLVIFLDEIRKQRWKQIIPSMGEKSVWRSDFISTLQVWLMSTTPALEWWKQVDLQGSLTSSRFMENKQGAHPEVNVWCQ